MVQATNGLVCLDLYDDFADNAKTGRTAPYFDIVDGTAGTVAISAVSPIAGTYSLTHVGGGASGSGNRWLYASTMTGKAGPYNYQYTADFDIKLVSHGANAAEPAGYVWFFEFTDTNNYTAAYTDVSGGNQRMRIFQKIGGVTTTLDTQTWLTGSHWADGATYHMTARVLDTGYALLVGTTTIVSATAAYLGATTYHAGGGGDWTTKLMWDNIRIRTEVGLAGTYVFKGTEPLIGAVGSELDLTAAAPSVTPTDDSTTLKFNVMSDFPVVLKTTTWDDIVTRTKPFYWSSTNTFQLGYNGLDQYMSLRLRVYAECTSNANFNVNSITFMSE